MEAIDPPNEKYRVNTELYEGPLDLLLQLIERSELDITRLAIAQVTDQFLEYLGNMEIRNPGEVSAFLVMAARLLQIKSQALLPIKRVIDVEENDVETSAEALARQLIQYRRFKQLGSVLDDLQKRGLKTYLRLNTPIQNLERHLDMEGLTIQDLIRAARNIFVGELELPKLSSVVNMPSITIREQIQMLIKLLRQVGPTTFLAALDHRSRLDAVILFLAMLELIKRRVVEAQQTSLFDEIVLTPVGEWDDNAEVELEFEE